MTLLEPERFGASPDLSNQDDVYADIGRDRSDRGAVAHNFCTVSVVSDASPMALARIFGLLSTFSIVPVTTQSTVLEAATINVTMTLRDINPCRVDLLCRKMSQLTETISVAVTDRAD